MIQGVSVESTGNQGMMALETQVRNLDVGLLKSIQQIWLSRSLRLLCEETVMREELKRPVRKVLH